MLTVSSKSLAKHRGARQLAMARSLTANVAPIGSLEL